MLYLIYLYQLHFHKCFPLSLLFLTIIKYTNDTFLLSAQCKSKTDYPVDKGPPVTPILCQIKPVNTLIFWSCKTRSAPQLCSMRPFPKREGLCINFYYAGSYKELSTSLPTPQLEGYPLSAVRNCLFSTFAVTVQNLGQSSENTSPLW
jgi:hypothetical protein